MIDGLISIISSFRIQDFLDILIISVLIYVAFIWFKNTASRFVFVGISLLGAIYIFARLFHLYLTSMVLQGFFAILLIALVVIFQEDIRRFFERLATWGSIRKPQKNEKLKDMPAEIGIVVEAMTDFALKKTGAIIVLHGRDHLERHLKGGYELDGILTQPLLESIFDRHSIGHDGAVVIDKGRLVKFGSHLPLSLETKKFGKFGLRHTAALGLTERCDALCIVASEEHGSIAVAREGKLKYVKNAHELSTIIEKFYEEETPVQSQHFPYQWVRKNSVEKAVAVFLALGLWFAFGYQKESIQRDFPVPIEYRKISQEWEVEGFRDKEATVTLSGPSQAFDLFDPSTLTISVDLSNLRNGEQEIILSSDTIKIPSNLSLVKISPETIMINAFKLSTLEVPVHIKTIKSVPKGLKLKSITSNPMTVAVETPKKLAKEKNKMFINTEYIDLSKIAETITLDVKLLSQSDIRFKNGQTPFVQVTVEVEKIADPQK
jgi:diadenylate cyclase